MDAEVSPHVLAGTKFLPLRGNHKNDNFDSPDKFFNNLEQHLSHNLSDVPKFFWVSLLAMKR